MKRQEFFAWIDSYLEVERYGDYSPIGLQVEGAPEITRVALGVSAHLELIEAAAAWGAQALLVHHGFFWPGESPVLKGWRKKRIKALLDHDLSLAGYHLPLDGHPEVGNNAKICDLLQIPAENRQPFAKAKGAMIGVMGRFDAPQPAAGLFETLKSTFGDRTIIFDAGPEQVDTVAVVTGSGANYFEEARELGAQVFITGEAREPTMAEARETQTHFVAAGHYNTETVGIKALGEHISKELGLEVRFFDVPNPV
jgi:dinuclear metal center YbgI/SA1388 family protein